MFKESPQVMATGKKKSRILETIMVMKPCCVLIISQQVLFIEALAQLIRTAGAHVQGRASSLDAASRLLQTQSVDAVIIDQAGVSQSETEIVTHLATQMEHYTVIFLTSGNDQMTVYRRQQVTYTAPSGLAQLLCLSA